MDLGHDKRKQNRPNVFFFFFFFLALYKKSYRITVNTTDSTCFEKQCTSLRIITFRWRKQEESVVDISMYYGISSTFALKRCPFFSPYLFLKGLFVFVACPVLATRKAPQCQRFDCPQDLFFPNPPILCSRLQHIYLYIYVMYTHTHTRKRACKRKGGGGTWDYHCNGVVSTLDSDRFPGQQKLMYVYIRYRCIGNGRGTQKKKSLRGKAFIFRQNFVIVNRPAGIIQVYTYSRVHIYMIFFYTVLFVIKKKIETPSKNCTDNAYLYIYMQ